MEEYINDALKEAYIASEKGEVPVGAVLVYNGKIIAKGRNQRVKKKNVLAHAEIECIIKGAKKLKDWRLSECDLYVTLEPCSMCREILKQSRIKNCYYLIKRAENKKEYDNTNICLYKNDIRDLSENYKKLLSDFFRINCKR